MSEPIIFLLLAGVGLVGLIFMVLVAPILFQVGTIVEAIAIMFGGLGEYFNRPGLFRGCCIVFALGLLGGCALCVILTIAGVTCFTGTPSSLCRFIGR